MNPVDDGDIRHPLPVSADWRRAVSDHLAVELLRATLVELPWAGHLPNLERPAETTGLIRRSIQP